MGSQEMLKGGNKDCLDAEQNAAMKKLQFLVIEVYTIHCLLIVWNRKMVTESNWHRHQLQHIFTFSSPYVGWTSTQDNQVALPSEWLWRRQRPTVGVPFPLSLHHRLRHRRSNRGSWRRKRSWKSSKMWASKWGPLAGMSRVVNSNSV